jgi:hypothetical protein
MSDTNDSDVPVSAQIEQFVASLPPLPAEQGGLGPPPSTVEEVAPQGIVTSPKAQEAPPEKEKEPDERYARGYARLAQREAQLAEKERVLEAKAAEAAKATEAQLQARFKANPIKTLKSLGLTTEQISQMGRAALGATLEGAPEQYRELAEKLSFQEQNEDVKSELEQLRQELKAEKEAKARDEYYAQVRAEYQANLQKYVETGLSAEAPAVSRLYAADPQETIRRLNDVVARDAQARLRAGASGDPLTPQQAAMALERELAPFAKAFGAAPSPQNAREAQTPARKTLSDSTVNPAPSNRSMPDPETDWEGWKKAQEQAWLADLYRKSQG